MKFNIDIDIDWINEDCELDDIVKNKIISTISTKILSKMEAKISTEAFSRAHEAADEKINTFFDSFLEQGFVSRDRWGDPTGKEIKIKDMLKAKLEKAMNEATDSNRRWEKLLNKNAKSQIDNFMNSLSEHVLQGIKKDIDEDARKRVTEAILSDYKLKQLIKGS